ncbi:MAG: ABC transporter permease [Acetobacteraceae bacterium]|nr:ABC transporter permease [Acetobacteraceae bacterium]
MSGRRLWAIVRKEFIQVLRDRATLIIMLAMPVAMMFIFGYAVSTDVDHIATALWDQDLTPASRLLVEKLQQSKYFEFTHRVRSTEEMRRLIDGGLVKAGLIIPPGFSRQLLQGETAQAQVVIDGSDPLVAGTALSTALSVAQAHGAELLAQRLAAAGLGSRAQPPIDLRPRVWYNPDLVSLRFNLPGLVGAILQNLTILLTAFALVREKERGTVEQLIVTPVRPAELVLGKLLPYVLIGMTEVAFTLAVGVLWFRIPVTGSVWLLFALSLVFVLSALGVGLFVSTQAQNQLQAMQMAFAFLLPSILLSGFIFPREAMPAVVRGLGYVIPLTYFLKVLRGIILKGVGLDLLWREVVFLGVYGVLILALASWRFRKKLD